MKNVIMLIASLVLGSVIIKQFIGGGRKHIRSRADDPTIPPISQRAF